MTEDDRGQPPPEDVRALRAALGVDMGRVRAAVDALTIRPALFPGDLTLFGYSFAVWEYLAATHHLSSTTELGYAAYPMVRSAFEAAQDALLLVTEPDFAVSGVRARVFEALEWSDIKAGRFDAFGEPDETAPSTDYSEATASLLSDATRWSHVRPGGLGIYESAIDDLLPRFQAAQSGKRHPAHWSLRGRRGIAVEIGRRVSDEAFGKNMIFTYSQLSRSSHPRLRTESIDRRPASPGVQRIKRATREERIVLGIAAVVAGMLMIALERRPALGVA